jgi:hypothetical protein
MGCLEKLAMKEVQFTSNRPVDRASPLEVPGLGNPREGEELLLPRAELGIRRL